MAGVQEFVEFLEESLGLKEDGKKASSSGSSSSSSGRRQDFGLDGNAVDAFDKLMEVLGLDKDDGRYKGGFGLQAICWMYKQRYFEKQEDFPFGTCGCRTCTADVLG